MPKVFCNNFLKREILKFEMNRTIHQNEVPILTNFIKFFSHKRRQSGTVFIMNIQSSWLNIKQHFLTLTWFISSSITSVICLWISKGWTCFVFINCYTLQSLHWWDFQFFSFILNVWKNSNNESTLTKFGRHWAYISEN